MRGGGLALSNYIFHLCSLCLSVCHLTQFYHSTESSAWRINHQEYSDLRLQQRLRTGSLHDIRKTLDKYWRQNLPFVTNIVLDES